MYLFSGSNHNGGMLESGVPMSRISLSQGLVHLSCNVPIRCSSHNGGELQLESRYVPVSMLKPQW